MIGRRVRLHWQTDNEMVRHTSTQFVAQKSASIALLPQNKTGMQLCDGSWYVLAEQACFLFQLDVASVEFNGQEVKDAQSMYKLIRQNSKDSLDMLYFYKSIRKNGLFCRRANHTIIKATLEAERGLANLKKNHVTKKGSDKMAQNGTFVVYVSQNDYLKDINGTPVIMTSPSSQVRLINGKVAVVSHADYNVINLKLMDV